MPSKKQKAKQRKIDREIEREIKKEIKRLHSLRLSHPAMFRKCGNNPCCQAETDDGYLCNRPAVTQKTYIQRARCCYLCWQHALMYGVYVAVKIAKNAATWNMSWDEYCSYYPEECEKMIGIQKEYK